MAPLQVLGASSSSWLHPLRDGWLPRGYSATTWNVIFWKFHVWEEVHQPDINLFDLVVADTVKIRKASARFSANMF